MSLSIPKGWDVERDPNTGLLYYIHGASKQKTWTDPRYPLPDGWVEEKDGNWRSFFTKKTSGGEQKSPVHTTTDPRGSEVQRILRFQHVPIPKFMEPRISPQNRCVYYADLVREITSWSDPRDPLPAGWREKRDKEGKPYYIHKESQRTTSSNPRKPLPSSWERRMDARGLYFQHRSGVVSWVHPADPLPNTPILPQNHNNNQDISSPNTPQPTRQGDGGGGEWSVDVDLEGNWSFVHADTQLSTRLDPRENLHAALTDISNQQARLEAESVRKPRVRTGNVSQTGSGRKRTTTSRERKTHSTSNGRRNARGRAGSKKKLVRKSSSKSRRSKPKKSASKTTLNALRPIYGHIDPTEDRGCPILQDPPSYDWDKTSLVAEGAQASIFVVSAKSADAKAWMEEYRRSLESTDGENKSSAGVVMKITKLKGLSSSEVFQAQLEIIIHSSPLIRHPCILTPLVAYSRPQSCTLILPECPFTLRDVIEQRKAQCYKRFLQEFMRDNPNASEKDITFPQHWSALPGWFSEHEIMHYLCRLVFAICHLHAGRILHLDIKPANMCLTLKHELQLADFGLSLPLTSDAPKNLPLSLMDVGHGVFMGTPSYSAPELMGRPGNNKQNHVLDYKLDVWAVGCVAYELCAGVCPFGGVSTRGVAINGDFWQLADRICKRHQAPLSKVYSQELRDAIASMLSKQARFRPHLVDILTAPLFQSALPSKWKAAKQ